MLLAPSQYKTELEKDYLTVRNHIVNVPQIEMKAWLRTLEGLEYEMAGLPLDAQRHYSQNPTDVAHKRLSIVTQILYQRSEPTQQPAYLTQYNYMPFANNVTVNFGVPPSSYIPVTYVPTPAYNSGQSHAPQQVPQAPSAAPAPVARAPQVPSAAPAPAARAKTLKKTEVEGELSKYLEKILLGLFREHQDASFAKKPITRAKFCEQNFISITDIATKFRLLAEKGLINYQKRQKTLPTLTLSGIERAKKLLEKQDPHLIQPPKPLVFRTPKSIPTPLQAPTQTSTQAQIVHVEQNEPKKNMMKISSLLN